MKVTICLYTTFPMIINNQIKIKLLMAAINKTLTFYLFTLWLIHIFCTNSILAKSVLEMVLLQVQLHYRQRRRWFCGQFVEWKGMVKWAKIISFLAFTQNISRLQNISSSVIFHHVVVFYQLIVQLILKCLAFCFLTCIVSMSQ